MNSKVIVGLVVAALLGGVWFYNSSQKKSTQSQSVAASNSTGKADQTSTNMNNSTADYQNHPELFQKEVGDPHSARTEDEFLDHKAMPASQKYKTADEALAALKKASVEYDDFVLEEFINLAECAWCDEVYGQVSKLISDPNLSIDERSFYGELLAVTGRLDNIKTLVSGIEGAKNDEEKDMFAESLELTVGNDEIVDYLSKYMDNSNESLRESSVAAVSNQGSRLAAETLYKDTVSGAGKDHDYYSLGIGLGEMVPDDEALPFLQDLVIQRAAHADLAVKALLNSGLNGLTLVFDSLASEKDETKGMALLKDATDHLINEDGAEAFLKKASENQNLPQFLRDFATEGLKEFTTDETDELE